MKRNKEIEGTYGSGKTPCTVFVCDGWYCVEGSHNVNRTYEDLEDGVDVEEVSDYDTFTSTSPIESLEELENAIND